MDLLGSLLGSMEKPPVIKKSAEEQEKIKKLQEDLKKRQDAEKQRLKKLREDIKAKIDKLIADETEQQMEFEPMEKIIRGIVHEIAEDAELQSVSVGSENDGDRRVFVYKKTFVLPGSESHTDNDLAKTEENCQDEKETSKKSRKKKEEQFTSSYHDKYKHIIGETTGISAAQITKPNQLFGCVPSSNKQDKRSIEETLQDMKKKRLKNLEASSSN